MSLMAIGTAWAQSVVNPGEWTYSRETMDGATLDTWATVTTLQPSGNRTQVQVTMAHGKAEGGNLLESSIILVTEKELPTNSFNLTFTDKASSQKKSVYFGMVTSYAKQGYFVYETMTFASCMDIIKSGATSFTMNFTNGQTATLNLDFNISKANAKTNAILKAMKISADKQWEADAFKTDNGKLYYAFDKDAVLKTGEKFHVQLILRIRGKNEEPGFYGSYVNLIFDRALPAEEFTLKFKCAANEEGFYIPPSGDASDAAAAKMETRESPFALYSEDKEHGTFIYQGTEMFLGNTLKNLTSREYTMEFAGGKKLQFTFAFSTKENVRWTVINDPE